MKNILTLSVMATAGLLQACAGGQITDGSGNAVTGSGNGNLLVSFRDDSGQSFNTGVDANGYFGYDTDAPASATNNPVALIGSNFTVTVSAKDGTSGQASKPINVSYNNATCPDHYVPGQTDKSCALFQIELLGTTVSVPPASYASSFVGFATTVVPLTTAAWCYEALAGFGVTNMSPRYNDITLQTYSAMPNVAWGWKVTKVTANPPYSPANVKIDAFGTIPANASGGWANGEAGGYIDIAQHFQGPDFYVYPNTVYQVSFFPGGLASSCAPKTVNFQTTYDTVPTCVIDHNCPVDPGSGDGGGGTCDSGANCCPGGFCSDPPDCGSLDGDEGCDDD